LYDAGHGHSQRGGKILFRHGAQPLGALQHTNQAGRETFRIACLIEFDRQVLALCHLLKILKIRTDNRNAVSAGQVGDPAAPGR
jgi:hypothetical protein